MQLRCWSCNQPLGGPHCALSAQKWRDCYPALPEFGPQKVPICAICDDSDFDIRRGLVVKFFDELDRSEPDFCLMIAVDALNRLGHLNHYRRILTDDDALKIYRGAVVRAKVYDDKKIEIEWSQEILGCHEFRWGKDPRRPVLMRGAVEVLLERYRSKSWWSEKVLLRFLRKTKYSSINRSENRDNLLKLMNTFGRKTRRWAANVRHYFEREYRVGYEDGKWCAWIDGEYKEDLDYNPALAVACCVCKKQFLPKTRTQKTCSESCKRQRSRINAKRLRAAYDAMKELGLLEEGDLL